MTNQHPPHVSGTIRQARANLIRDAIRFANLAAGEGIKIDGLAPEDFMTDYTLATYDEDWDTIADRLAAIQPDPQPVASEPVSVAEAAKVLLDARNKDGMTVFPDYVRDMLRALSEERK